MNSKTYTECCRRTWSGIGDNIEHCAYGMVTEAVENLDMLKKHKFYGREFNMVNLKEEVGDLLYYIHILLDEINYSIEDCMDDNIKKLSKRYPDKFEDIVFRNQEHELSHIKETK